MSLRLTEAELATLLANIMRVAQDARVRLTARTRRRLVALAFYGVRWLTYFRRIGPDAEEPEMISQITRVPDIMSHALFMNAWKSPYRYMPARAQPAHNVMIGAPRPVAVLPDPELLRRFVVIWNFLVVGRDAENDVLYSN